MSLISHPSYTHTYQNNSEINFFVNEQNALSVTIDTDRLHIRSVAASEEEVASYASLFGDQEVMGKFATGETKTPEEIKTRINQVWIKRWNQNDPYTGLAIFRNDTDEFIGHTAIGHGDKPGQSELAYLFMKNHWGKGFGTEAITAVVKEYAPATIQEGYTLNGKVLEEITATARPDNPGSVKILEKVGMHKVREEEKYGAMRYHFSIGLSELIRDS
jgi:ribosomal-protein-alanine N-acetyltransferase